MGKVKRLRQKFHESSKKKSESNKVESNTSGDQPLTVPDNIFSNLNIDFDAIKKELPDDTRSVISVKSLKSEHGLKHIPKKDKIKLRHEVLLNKIDALEQLKKQNKIRKKRKNNVIMGDTNSLHDALPSLDSLKKRDFKITVNDPNKKKKPIAKASQRKKTLINELNLFKKLISDKKYNSDPFTIIKQCVETRVKTGDL